EIEIAERHPDALAAPAHVDRLALERHRLAKRRNGLWRQLLLETGLEGEFTGADNQLAHRSLLLEVAEDVVQPYPLQPEQAEARPIPALSGGFSAGRSEQESVLPQLWARAGTGRGGPPPCLKAPPKSAIGGDTMARSRWNASGISSRMKASSFSLISQRRS